MTCHEYHEATDRLLYGQSLDDVTADLLLHTVKGIDALRLFALLLEPECVASKDVGMIGVSLARDFLHDGHSFALFELFDAAGDKLCRSGAEKYACTAADVATTALMSHKYKFEDLEFLQVRRVAEAAEPVVVQPAVP